MNVFLAAGLLITILSLGSIAILYLLSNSQDKNLLSLNGTLRNMKLPNVPLLITSLIIAVLGFFIYQSKKSSPKNTQPAKTLDSTSQNFNSDQSVASKR